MKYFELNGKKYNIVPMTFNTVCELEEKGVSLSEISNKGFGFIRAYISIACGIDIEEAGNEIEKHIIDGKDLNGIFELIGKEIEESNFFQALSKNEGEETPKVEK